MSKVRTVVYYKDYYWKFHALGLLKIGPGRMNSRQEKILKDFSDHSIGAPFIFCPDNTKPLTYHSIPGTGKSQTELLLTIN